MSKRVRQATFPKEQKTPRISRNNNPQQSGSHTPSWRFDAVDFDGPWCPRRTLPSGDFWGDVLPRLQAFERMNWTQIESAGSHAVPIGNLIPGAQRRLEEINQIDIDSLFSLRVSGRKRIWGIRFGSVLRMIWWDPEHQICPSTR